MQSFSWAPEHSAALREYLVRGMSYAEAANAINARFATAYTRNAALSRGKRMGLVVRAEKAPSFIPRSQRLPKVRAKAKSEAESAKKSKSPLVCGAAEASPPPPAVVRPEPPRLDPPRLRCVGISPRLVCLLDLEAGECRYPYGGDREGEAITFCGHPCFRGSAYCAPHFHLTRAPALEGERPAGPFILRLVEAA